MRRLAVRIAVLSFVSLAVFFVYTCFLEFHGTAEICLDSGDLRYLYYGITVDRKLMSEPDRTKLLALAENASLPKGRWCRCASFPLSGSNHPDGMYQNFYRNIVPWIEVDPVLARLMLEDVADYVQRTHAEGGLPAISLLVPWCFEKAGKDTVSFPHRVSKDWQENELLKDFMQDPPLDLHEKESPLFKCLQSRLVPSVTGTAGHISAGP